MGVGCSSVTQDEEAISAMTQLGEKIGICFQIKDDLFDYGTSDVGKPTGIDIKEKKMTLPLIYALNNTDKSTKRSIIYDIKNNSTDDKVVKRVINFVKEHNGIEYTNDMMLTYQKEALDMLKNLPQGPAIQHLESLLLYITNRKN